MIVNNNDNLVEVRKIKLSLLRVSILLKENSAQDKKSLCVREKIGIMDNLSKKKKVDCVTTVGKGVVVVVISWVGLEGTYNGKRLCTRDLNVVRDRGINLGGLVKGRVNFMKNWRRTGKPGSRLKPVFLCDLGGCPVGGWKL